MTTHIVCESNKFCFYKHDHFDKSKNQFFSTATFVLSDRSFYCRVTVGYWFA